MEPNQRRFTISGQSNDSQGSIKFKTMFGNLLSIAEKPNQSRYHKQKPVLSVSQSRSRIRKHQK